MEFFVRHWYLIAGTLAGLCWLVLLINRHRIKSPWLRSILGLSFEDPLLKAAMQGRKDFTNREVWGWGVVLLLLIVVAISQLVQ